MEKYGGEYIVRGGKTEVLEGDWKPKRIVVLEFESAERAKEWLNCEEYRRTAQNAPPHSQDKYDPGGRACPTVAWRAFRLILAGIFCQSGGYAIAH